MQNGITYRTNGSHGMVDSTRTKTTLDDLKPTSFAQDHVALVDSDVFEGDVTVAVRGVIKANNRQHAFNRDAGRICRHENDRLLSIDVLVCWVGLGHDNVDLAPAVASTT